MQLREKSGDRLTGCCIRAQYCERGQKTAKNENCDVEPFLVTFHGLNSKSFR